MNQPQKILKRTWIPQEIKKSLPHKGYRYDEGTWFSEIQNNVWRSFVILKREITDSNEIIEYLLEDEQPRLPYKCLWIEEYEYDSIPSSQQHELLVQDWRIVEQTLQELPFFLELPLQFSCPPQMTSQIQKKQLQVQQSPSQHLQHQQKKQHSLKHPKGVQHLKKPVQSVQSVPSKHTKTKEKVRKPNKFSGQPSNQSSLSPENHEQPKQPNSNKQAIHHPQFGVSSEPLPILQWTPLQTLLQVPLQPKQQVSVSVDPKGKSQNLPRKRAGRPKKLNSKNSTHADSLISAQKPLIVTM